MMTCPSARKRLIVQKGIVGQDLVAGSSEWTKRKDNPNQYKGVQRGHYKDHYKDQFHHSLLTTSKLSVVRLSAKRPWDAAPQPGAPCPELALQRRMRPFSPFYLGGLLIKIEY